MGSISYLTLASVIDSFQASQIISGGTRQQTPLVDTTWSYDGDPATLIQFGTNNGTTPTWTSGAAVWDLADIAALSSGQAIGFLLQTDGFVSTLGNELQVIARNMNTGIDSLIQWTQPSGGGGNFPGPPPGRAAGSDWRTDINFMRMVVNAYRSASPPGSTNASIATYSQLRFAAHVYNRPTLTVAALGTVTTTLRPTVSWTFSPDTAGGYAASQGSFRVRVFTAAQYGAGGFDPASSTATYDSGIVASASNSFTLPTNLVNGTTYRAYVIAAQTLPYSLYQHWTTDGTTWATLGAAAYTQFNIATTPPPVPTVILPAAAATVTTDLPVLGATLGASGVTGAQVRAEWQLATDAGFTNNLRTVLESALDYRTSGVTTEQMVAAFHGELFQGTWYIRCREQDTLGVYGSYSTGQSFSVSHPPTSTNHNPTGQQTQKYAATNTFAWQFADTSPTDVQTAFQLIIEKDSDGTSQYDSGKQVSAAQSFAVAISSGLKATLLRWKIRLYDSDDVVGAYSANQQFYVRDPGTITHLVPTSGGVVDNPQPTITWTYTGSGYSQVSYQAVIKEAGVVVVNSGLVPSATNAYTLASPILQTGHSYTLELTIRDNFGIESTSIISFTAAWVPPPAPTITIDVTPFDVETLGYVKVTWPQNRDVNFVNYKVYRRLVNDAAATWELAGTVTSTGDTTYEFHDYTARANQAVYYAVTQSALRFGVPVESTIGSLTANQAVIFNGSQYVLYTLPTGADTCVSVATSGYMQRVTTATPTAYTLAGWFKPVASAATQAVFVVNPPAGGSRSGIFYGGNLAKFRLEVNGGGFTNGSSTQAVGLWHHVALVVSGTTASLYVNGVFEVSATVAAGTKITSGDYLSLGAWRFGAAGLYSNFFAGEMDEAMYFDRALGLAEIGILANRFPGPSAWVSNVQALGPYAWWRLNDVSGTTALDASGNARNGTYMTTGVTYGVAGAITNSVTACVWVKPTTTAGSAQAIIAFNTIGNNRAEAFWGVSNLAKFTLFTESPATFTAEATTRATGTWYHVALVIENTTATLYVNGVLAVQTTSIASNNNPAAGDQLSFGQEFDGVGVASNQFTGSMDEAMYFDRALTAADLLYLCDLAVDETIYPARVLSKSPYAWWRLADASGAVAVDSSGNGRDAAYVGTPTYSQPGVIATIPQYTPASTHYWLIAPDNPSDNFRLSLVKSDQLTDEWEREELLLLGRGRRVERGTNWGVRGSIQAEVYDGQAKTAKQISDGLDLLQGRNLTLYLRNPFGGLYKCAVGDFQKDRMPGVGVNEYLNLTFEYIEVS